MVRSQKQMPRGNNLGEFGAGDIAFVLGYGNQLDQNFYYGANVKLIYSAIDEVSSVGLAVDLGLQYVFPESNWSFGFSALNLGSQVKSYFDVKEDLPVDVRIGFSKSLERLPFKFFWSFNKINEQQDNILKRFTNITFGGEFRLGQSLRLRLGYDNEKRKELKIGTSAGLAGFSLGFGFIVKGYNVDYAFFINGKYRLTAQIRHINQFVKAIENLELIMENFFPFSSKFSFCYTNPSDLVIFYMGF